MRAKQPRSHRREEWRLAWRAGLATGMVAARKQRRHKYCEMASARVAQAIEALMGLAADSGHLRTRSGPRDDALRAARSCYNHLAGSAGVRLYDSLTWRGFLNVEMSGLSLSADGRGFMAHLGIDIERLAPSGGEPRPPASWSGGEELIWRLRPR